jgi:hypothetical protein
MTHNYQRRQAETAGTGYLGWRSKALAIYDARLVKYRETLLVGFVSLLLRSSLPGLPQILKIEAFRSGMYCRLLSRV